MRIKATVVAAALLVAAATASAPPADAGTTQPTLTRVNTIPDQVVFSSTDDHPLSVSVETDEPPGWRLDRATFSACRSQGYQACTLSEQWLSVQSVSQLLQARFVTFAGAVPNVADGLLTRHIQYQVVLSYTSPTGSTFSLSTGRQYLDLDGDSRVTLDGPDHADAGAPVTLSGTVSCFTRDGYTSPPVDPYGWAGWVDLYYRVSDTGAWKYGGSADSFNADTGEFSYTTSGATADWYARYYGNTCTTASSPVHHVDAGVTPPPPPPPALPGEPGLGLHATTYHSIGLSWTPPSDAGASPVIGYHWGWTSNNGLPQASWDAVYPPDAADPMVLDNLSPSTTYAVWVAAITKDGEGRRATLAVTTKAAPGNPPPAPHRPGRPARVHARATMHTAWLYWSTPRHNGGAPLAGYQVHRPGISHDIGRRHHAWHFTKLRRHTTYRLYVRAKNPAGYGRWVMVRVHTR